MAFLNIPIKSIEASINSVIGTETMPWYNPQNFPVQPGDPYPEPVPKDYRWRVTMDITAQPQSSYLTRDPGTYNGQDISVGQWIANTSTGQAWQIINIESKSATQVIATVQDIYRYNTFRDVSGSGNGSPNVGIYVVFSLGDNGFPEIDPVPPSGVSYNFAQNLQSRFEYINTQYDYPLYQAGNTFAVGDVIAASSATNSFVLSSDVNRLVVGRVTSISDTIPGWFTINPVQKIVDYLDTLPGNIGDVIYTSLTNPGELTLDSGGTQVYIKLRNDTSSISGSTRLGPTAAGNVFQINGVDATVNGTGSEADVINATNLISLQTGVSAVSAPSPTSVSTNPVLVNATYNEPALYAATGPYAIAMINSVTVIFNVTSTDVGYENYCRPVQMAQVINAANIPNIVAEATSQLSLTITNTAGGPINIANIIPDSNGVNFAGSNSGSGLMLTTSPSITTYIKFTAVDARAINFMDVIGNTTYDYGLVSVENGVKACGLYIESGLRSTTSTVVADLTQLNALSPLIGDQAYVINSSDGQGNNVNEWSLWIYDGIVWVRTSNEDSASTDARTFEFNLVPTSNTTYTIGNMSTGRRVSLITVDVVTPFNGSPTLTLGYSINNPSMPPAVPAGLMTNDLVDLNVAGTYVTQSGILFGVDTVEGDVSITMEFHAVGATVGSARIVVSYV